MVDIFISYRHDDAGSAVALHRENIKRLFGPAVEVFLDDRSIEPGEPFPDEIRAALLGSRLVLAFAGQSYARHLRERADRVDWVREELLSAREADIPIWPILVDGQREFDAEDLPEAVRWFAELNAVTIRGASSDDGDALLRRIDEFLVRPSATSTYSFSESEWELLVEGLKEGTCVPIVGTGLGKLDYTGPPPMALRRESGDERMFSLLGGEDLPRVAQVLATERNPSHPRKKLRDWARSRSYKSRSDHPYAVLAQLGLPLYISTSYEDGLATYLEAGGGAAQRMRYSSDSGSIGSDGAEHSPALPVVLQLLDEPLSFGDGDLLAVCEEVVQIDHPDSHAMIISVDAGGVFNKPGRRSRLLSLVPFAGQATAYMRSSEMMNRVNSTERIQVMVERFRGWRDWHAAGGQGDPPEWTRRGVLFGLHSRLPEAPAEWQNTAPEVPEWAGNVTAEAWGNELAAVETSLNKFTREQWKSLIYRSWWLTGASLARWHPELLRSESYPEWTDF